MASGRKPLVESERFEERCKGIVPVEHCLIRTDQLKEVRSGWSFDDGRLQAKARFVISHARTRSHFG